jgi:hypothetical protein
MPTPSLPPTAPASFPPPQPTLVITNAMATKRPARRSRWKLIVAVKVRIVF